MRGCDDQDYAVTVLVANTYKVTAIDEREAISKATRAWLNGEKAPSVMPRGTEVQALGKSREELVEEAIAKLETK